MNTPYGVYEETGGTMDRLDSLTPSAIGDSFDATSWLNQIDAIMDGQPDDQDLQYAELRNLQQQSVTQQQHHQQQNINQDRTGINKEQRDDDGYGSQTILVTGIMDPTPLDDDFDPFIRERCHTWPSIQHTADDDLMTQQPSSLVSRHSTRSHYRAHPFSPPGHHGSRGSSQLSLISESNESLLSSPRTRQSELTYVTGLLNGNSPESTPVTTPPAATPKPPTAAMMGGTYKAGHPSYVELITQAILSSPEKRMTLSEIYDWMVANVDAFKDQRYLHSSSGWKNSVRHNLSLHSRFKRVKRNGMDKPSWWTVDLTEESKRERNNKRPAKQPARQRANTTTGAIYHPPQSANNRRTTIDSNTTISQIQKQQQQQQMSKYPTSVESVRRVRNVQVKSNGTDWSQQLVNSKFESKNIVSQAITVTLNDVQQGATKSKPEIALTLTMGGEHTQHQSNGFYQSPTGTMTNLVDQFRQNTLEENATPVNGRQLLRVQTSSGQIQEVAVPVPMPIKVVLKANKDCQTDMTADDMFTSTLASGYWPTETKEEGGFSALDVDCLMNFGEMKEESMVSPHQYLNTVGTVNTLEVMGGNQEMTSTFAVVSQQIANAPLPDDLAAVDVRDALDCNIMDILSYEMNCTTKI